VKRQIAPANPPALAPALRRPIAVVAILAAVALSAFAVRYSGEAAPGRLDMWAQTAVEGLWPQPGLGTIVIATMGDPLSVVVLTVLMAAACLRLGRRRLAVVAVAGVGMTGIVTTALKPVVGRTIHGEFLAYPSGHTAAATVLTLVVALLLVDLLEMRRLPGVLLILATTGVAGSAMALTQVIQGTHYATDTVGGFCAAVVIVPATAILVDRFAERRVGSPPHRGR
jgi:membrane-associated phospholipid phosphatase